MFSRKMVVSAFVLLASAASAQAGSFQFDFSMDGLQETPPVATPGTGACTVLLDSGTGAVDVNCTFSGLVGTTNNAHIHGPAPIGSPAGVILGLTFDFGVTSGTITGNGILSAAHTQAMIDGLTYINLHTTFRPGGEIRGQIIPEPASALLLGLSGLVVLRRR
jgi:hypothetical protein